MTTFYGLRRYTRKVGLNGRFTTYSCRHTRITRLLEVGVPDVNVATIMGNTPAVIHRHYSHVAAHTSRLVNILDRVADTDRIPPAVAPRVPLARPAPNAAMPSG